MLNCCALSLHQYIDSSFFHSRFKMNYYIKSSSRASAWEPVSVWLHMCMWTVVLWPKWTDEYWTPSSIFLNRVRNSERERESNLYLFIVCVCINNGCYDVPVVHCCYFYCSIAIYFTSFSLYLTHGRRTHTNTKTISSHTRLPGPCEPLYLLSPLSLILHTSLCVNLFRSVLLCHISNAGVCVVFLLCHSCVW